MDQMQDELELREWDDDENDWDEDDEFNEPPNTIHSIEQLRALIQEAVVASEDGDSYTEEEMNEFMETL